MAEAPKHHRRFPLRLRAKQARQDTRGFGEWLRNFVIASVAAAVTYAVQRTLWNQEEALKGLWLSVAVLIATFVLIPALEFAWNVLRAPRRILEEENYELLKENDKLREMREAASLMEEVQFALSEQHRKGAELREEEIRSEIEFDSWLQRFNAWQMETLSVLEQYLSPADYTLFQNADVLGERLPTYQGHWMNQGQDYDLAMSRQLPALGEIIRSTRDRHRTAIVQLRSQRSRL